MDQLPELVFNLLKQESILMGRWYSRSFRSCFSDFTSTL